VVSGTSLKARLGMFRSRQADYSALHQQMLQIGGIYNNKIMIPMEDMKRSESVGVPNLLAQGVDQLAGRAASVTPQPIFASVDPGNRSKDRKARASSNVIQGWRELDNVPLKMRQRFRQFIAYALSPVIMAWDPKDNRPTWDVRHPITCYPSPDLSPGQVRPDDVFFTYRRSVGWLTDHGYGAFLYRLFGTDRVGPEVMLDMLEFYDGEQVMLLATSRSGFGNYQDVEYGSMRGVVLEQYEHGMDGCPVVVPTRLTLDTITGQFDNMVGMYLQMARLQALEYVAVEKSVFPDTVIESRPGEIGRVIDGPHDGRSGLITVIAGGTMRDLQTTPGYMVNPTLDRLERSQRVTASLPAEFGGESASNIRTGRRGDAVLSATIDATLAEMQDVMAYAIREENKLAIALAQKYDGDSKRTIYIPHGPSLVPVTYTAKQTFETDQHVVVYPVSGADANTMTIAVGQRMGLGYMSKKSAQIMDALITDPEGEHDQLIAEGLEQALLSGIQQKASTGEMPPLVVAKLMTTIKSDTKELAEAMVKVTEDAMAEQQAVGPPQTADAAMAGGAVAAMAGVQNPKDSMPGAVNLSQMLGALRRPAMDVVPYRNASRGGM
jgi:hypothetical protein